MGGISHVNLSTSHCVITSGGVEDQDTDSEQSNEHKFIWWRKVGWKGRRRLGARSGKRGGDPGGEALERVQGGSKLSRSRMITGTRGNITEARGKHTLKSTSACHGEL